MSAETSPVLDAGNKAAAQPGQSLARLRLSRFLQHRAAVASFILLLLFAIGCYSAGLIAAFRGIDPNAIDLSNIFGPPSSLHWLGTDDLGRDVFIRLLYGGQVSLTVGLVTALIAAVFGTTIGLLAGYYGGRFDEALMRVTDAIIALPILPLLIIMAAVDLSKVGVPPEISQSESASLYRIVIIIALFGWTTVARLVRGATLSVRARDYVRAAEALGASNRRIMLVHILPNVASPILVATTLSIGNIVLAESVLSFLGLGIQPPLPSWGNMLTNAQDLIWSAPWLTVYPGLAIFATVIAFNFLGDGLQDALNPRSVKPGGR